MRPRIWQPMTAALTIACLTFTASAQLDTGTEQPRAERQQQSADQSQELRLGTVDLMAVSKAYKESKKQDQGREGAGLQEPAQADDPARIGQQSQSEDSGIDQQMLDEIRQQARSVAEEEGVDMIVLEVLHENGSDVETVDLTDRVIESFEQGSDQQRDGEQSELQSDSPLQSDSEQDADAENESDSDAAW